MPGNTKRAEIKRPKLDTGIGELTDLLSLSGSHPGELGHVLHHLEVGPHLVSQPRQVAELGDQEDGRRHVLLLLGLPLPERRWFRRRFRCKLKTGLPWPC